jgi:hypothetical protein
MIPSYQTLTNPAGGTGTPWKQPDYQRAPFQLSIGCVVTGGGTINYTIQYTYDDFWTAGQPSTPTAIFNDTAVNGATATADTTFNNPITGWRVLVNSSSGTVTFAVKSVQAGLP